jgi:hypothetical protein
MPQADLSMIQTQMAAIAASMVAFGTKLDTIEVRVNETKEGQARMNQQMPTKIELKGKGNKRQHELNTGVRTDIRSGIGNIKSVPPTPELLAAIEVLEKGDDVLKKRNKLIHYADTTSWAAAEEYLGPEPAEDSDDEKKMRRCEAAAERKMKASRGKRGNGASRGGGQRYQTERYVLYHNNRRSDDKGRIGPCYECGRMGHLAFECRSKRQYPYKGVSNNSSKLSIQPEMPVTENN